MGNEQYMGTEEFVKRFFTFSFDRFGKFDSIKSDSAYELASERVTFDPDQNPDLIKVNLKNDRFIFKLNVDSFKEANENIIIICIRDNSNLLEFLLPTLVRTAEINRCDILVVDDRSKDLSNVQIAEKYGASCLRIANSANIYNYSMLNNIAVKVASIFNKKQCIFWNCDMWAPDDETLGRLLEKHKQSKATLSGTRLIYPSREDYKKIFEGYDHSNGDPERFFGKIQHGGIFFQQFEMKSDDKTSLTSFFPVHQWRYYQADHYLACKDMPALAVTGALWIISPEDYMSVGGLAPSMPDVCQDMDFCLRLIANQKLIYYIGTEFLWHAENILHKKFETEQNTRLSDYKVFEYIWEKKIKNIIGIEAIF
jgi:GT2 family glycosyltransferase